MYGRGLGSDSAWNSVPEGIYRWQQNMTVMHDLYFWKIGHPNHFCILPSERFFGIAVIADEAMGRSFEAFRVSVV